MFTSCDSEACFFFPSQNGGLDPRSTGTNKQTKTKGRGLASAQGAEKAKGAGRGGGGGEVDILGCKRKGGEKKRKEINAMFIVALYLVIKVHKI